MRVKKFYADTSVTAQLIRLGEPDPRPMVERELMVALSGDLRGPRGGRYVPIEDPTVLALGQNADDFIRNTYTFRATVRAKYVRPRKTPAAMSAAADRIDEAMG